MADYTPLEQYFRDTVDFLDSIGFRYFVHGSTLLGKVRNNCLLQREDVLHDKELNFGYLAEDMTPRIYYEIKRHNKYFEPYSGDVPNHLIFFGPDELKPDTDHWSLPYFTLIVPYWIGKTKAVEYLGSDIACVWDKELITGEWDTLEMCGKKVKAPHKHKRWLKTYYGDYMTEQKVWHYSGDSLNKLSFTKLIEEKELCLY